MIRTSSAAAAATDLELLERERAEGRVHRAREPPAPPTPGRSRRRAEPARDRARCRAEPGARPRPPPRRRGSRAPRTAPCRGRRAARRGADGRPERAGHRVAHLPAKLASGCRRSARWRSWPPSALRPPGRAPALPPRRWQPQGPPARGGATREPWPRDRPPGGRWPPRSRLSPCRAAVPARPGSAEAAARRALQVAEFRGGQGACQPTRGRLHGRRLARRVGAQRVESPRERDHAPARCSISDPVRRSSSRVSSASRARAVRSSGSPAAPAGESVGRELAPPWNPASLVRRRGSVTRTTRAGRPRRAEPRLPGGTSTAAMRIRRRRRSTPTSATTQSIPRARSRALAVRTTAQERHDGDGPHADGASSARWRRTSVAPHPPRVGGASTNPATPGASARRRRMIARWTPRPRP